MCEGRNVSTMIDGRSSAILRGFLLGFGGVTESPEDQLPALSTGDGVAIVLGNPLHLGPMCGLSISRIAQDHAVPVQRVQVPLRSSIPGHGRTMFHFD